MHKRIQFSIWYAAVAFFILIALENYFLGAIAQDISYSEFRELVVEGKVKEVVIGKDEREQTLNQLLVEMDGFDVNTGVIIMAATNRPEILDMALLRPGRFDRQILVDRPNVRGREAILKIHVRNVRLASEVDLNVIAARTPGFVGADLANVVNEAALHAARRGKKEVQMEDFEEAIDRIIAGLKKKGRLINEAERNIVAYHESGHAITAECLPLADKVHRVSIIPRGIPPSAIPSNFRQTTGIS